MMPVDTKWGVINQGTETQGSNDTRYTRRRTRYRFTWTTRQPNSSSACSIVTHGSPSEITIDIYRLSRGCLSIIGRVHINHPPSHSLAGDNPTDVSPQCQYEYRLSEIKTLGAFRD